MKPSHVVQLLVLAALWGASFLFIRVGVAEFGVAPLMALRVSIGAVVLAQLVVLVLGWMRAARLFGLMRLVGWTAQPDTRH